MKIRYQNGTALEGVTLARTALTMRVAVQDRDDVVELTNIHGIWVSEDCEPVTLELGMTFEPVEMYTDDDFICPQALASHLVNLLFSDSKDDLLDEARLIDSHFAPAPTLLA